VNPSSSISSGSLVFLLSVIVLLNFGSYSGSHPGSHPFSWESSFGHPGSHPFSWESSFSSFSHPGSHPFSWESSFFLLKSELMDLFNLLIVLFSVI
jgi:hypothetical protein